MKFLLAAFLFTAAALTAQTPGDSQHRRGPHGLEGWTRSAVIETLENQGPLPVELILARNGHIIRRITDGPFIWNFIFLLDGRQVAYETGSLHFNLSCVLVDIASGKQLATYDCFQELAKDVPHWVELLEHEARTPQPLAK